MNWPQVTWDLRPMCSGKSQLPFHDLDGWDCTDWPQVTWDLGPVCSGKSQLPFHDLNGWDCTDWPQVTWDMGPWEPALKTWPNKTWSAKWALDKPRPTPSNRNNDFVEWPPHAHTTLLSLSLSLNLPKRRDAELQKSLPHFCPPFRHLACTRKHWKWSKGEIGALCLC